MVLISKVIMVVTIYITLCEASPLKKPIRGKHRGWRRRNGHWKHERSHLPSIDDLDGEWASSLRNFSEIDHEKPAAGTSDSSKRLEDDAPKSSADSASTQHRTAYASNRGRYEHLCDTFTQTVHLNTDTDEYNPPFYVEVRCRHEPQHSHHQPVQKCAFNLLHCVQTYSSLSFSRRRADSADCWQPVTLDVPSGCECMWPIEEFGPLNRHDDL